jgi:hypothetical protein
MSRRLCRGLFHALSVHSPENNNKGNCPWENSVCPPETRTESFPNTVTWSWSLIKSRVVYWMNLFARTSYVMGMDFEPQICNLNWVTHCSEQKKFAIISDRACVSVEPFTLHSSHFVWEKMHSLFSICRINYVATVFKHFSELCQFSAQTLSSESTYWHVLLQVACWIVAVCWDCLHNACEHSWFGSSARTACLLLNT